MEGERPTRKGVSMDGVICRWCREPIERRDGRWRLVDLELADDIKHSPDLELDR